MIKTHLKIIKEKLYKCFKPELYSSRQKVFNSRKSFYKQFLNQDDLCFDVGANYGNRVEVFLSLNCKVIAIEPQPDCIDYLAAKFGKQIHIEPIGLGETPGFLNLNISESSTVASFSTSWISEVKKGRFKNESWSRVRKTEVSTLNKLIDKYGMPRFIKIDVEGYELNVLRGLDFSIDVISIEYTTPEFTEELLKCIKEAQRINKDYKCNFSAGEENKFSFDNWMSVSEFYLMVSQDDSFLNGFGDVYFSLRH